MKRYLIKVILTMVTFTSSSLSYSVIETQNTNIKSLDVQSSKKPPIRSNSSKKPPIISKKIPNGSPENPSCFKAFFELREKLLKSIKKFFNWNLKSWYNWHKNKPEFKMLGNPIPLLLLVATLFAMGFLLGQSSKPNPETTPIKAYPVGIQNQNLNNLLLNGDDLKPIIKLLFDSYGKVTQTNLSFGLTMAKKFSSRLFQRIVADIKDSQGSQNNLQPLTKSFLNLIDIFDIDLLNQLLHNSGSINSWYEIIIKPFICIENIGKIFKNFEKYLNEEMKKINTLYHESPLSDAEKENHKKLNSEHEFLTFINKNIQEINKNLNQNNNILFLIKQIPNILKFLNVVFDTKDSREYLYKLLDYVQTGIETLTQGRESLLVHIIPLGVVQLTSFKELADHIKDEDKFKALVDPITESIAELKTTIWPPMAQENQANFNNFIYFFSKYLISFFKNIITNRQSQWTKFKDDLIVYLGDGYENQSFQDLFSDDGKTSMIIEKIFNFLGEPNDPKFINLNTDSNDPNIHSVAQQSKEFLTIWAEIFKNLLQIFDKSQNLFYNKIKPQFSINSL